MKRIQHTEGPEAGILEWFHLGDREHVLATLERLKEMNISKLRTGFSWADYHTPEGEAWYEWLIPTLSAQVEVLPCFLYTPPSIGREPKTSSPPVRLKDYADFIDMIMHKYHAYFPWVELWNEPNNISEYDYTLDTNWELFTEMIGTAAAWLQSRWKKRTVLGGMSPIDLNWLEMMYRRGLMEHIDVVGIHGFPGVFEKTWPGWPAQIKQLQELMSRYKGEQQIWITETGFSTWQHDEKQQLEEFIKAKNAPVERFYWYSLRDLPAERSTVDGFHTDEREYHFGLLKADGEAKLLYRLLKHQGVGQIEKYRWLVNCEAFDQTHKYVLITGGAGFIGTNLAVSLLESGKKVLILDNLSRPGVENNLQWLREKYPELLSFRIADMRNRLVVQQAVQQAEAVFHFAAQVAVTSSCKQPYFDFEVNAQGTMNLLESIRQSAHQPPLFFTSTNKVYGGLEKKAVKETDLRYELQGEQKAFDEHCAMNLHTPYGCSKGTADNYILDYARTFGLKTVVLRLSCIYGPHQHGNEDQGWVAHFLLQTLKNQSITIFGNGKQVRDILYADDLVHAFQLAWEHIDRLQGQAFNLGGGFENSLSLKELITLIESLHKRKVSLQYDDWRAGDQKYYVSDYQKFAQITGWKPQWQPKQGVKNLYEWLLSSDRMITAKDKVQADL